MSDKTEVLTVLQLSGLASFQEKDKATLSAAKGLAQKLNASVKALLLSEKALEADDVSGLAVSLGRLGVQTVFIAPAFAGYNSVGIAALITRYILENKPNVLLASHTVLMADLLPCVAAKTDSGLVTLAEDMSIGDDGQMVVTRACYGESLLSFVTVQAEVSLVTVKNKAFSPEVSDESLPPASVEHLPDLAEESKPVGLTRLSVEVMTETKTKPLSEAEIVVSGGRGLQSAENFHVVESLAKSLGGAVGASRAVVDAGWRPHSEQVGQTGKTVSPKLYIALGISGAIQHLVGMNNSKRIVAINRDENAPIFKLADFGIVGDALELAPMVTKAIEEKCAVSQ